MTTKEFTDFLEKEIMTEKDKENIFAPPLEPQIAFDILQKHFLGEYWYSVNPISTKQINTEVVYEILSRYPRKRNIFEKVKALWQRKF